MNVCHLKSVWDFGSERWLLSEECIQDFDSEQKCLHLKSVWDFGSEKWSLSEECIQNFDSGQKCPRLKSASDFDSGQKCLRLKSASDFDSEQKWPSPEECFRDLGLKSVWNFDKKNHLHLKSVPDFGSDQRSSSEDHPRLSPTLWISEHSSEDSFFQIITIDLVEDNHLEYIGRHGISLSGSYRQGYFTAYNTQSHIKVVCNGYILVHILNWNTRGPRRTIPSFEGSSSCMMRGQRPICMLVKCTRVSVVTFWRGFWLRGVQPLSDRW